MRPCLPMLALLLLSACAGMLTAAEHVWIEAETAEAEVPLVAPEDGPAYRTHGWGRTELISGGKWIDVIINAKQVAQRIPEEGAVFAWPFTLADDAEYVIWARLGLEWVRAPFDWRIDDGEWQRVHARQNPTVDIYEISNWNELAWLDLATMPLSAGEHRLQVRLPRITGGKKNELQAVKFRLDAFCISSGRFVPDGVLKPGEDWRNERDHAATGQVFAMPEDTGDGRRSVLDLAGLWQYASWCERGHIPDPFAPTTEVPAADAVHWRAYQVPGDRNAQYPERWFHHRFIARARIDIPASHAGRRFLLDVEEKNFIASVFVNGRYIAYDDNPLCPMQIDVTDGVEPGAINELWIVFKDQYYGLRPDEVHGARSWFNSPRDKIFRNQGITFKFAYPLKGMSQAGMTDRVQLVSAGPVYAEDVYAIPKVADGRLDVEVTLVNPGSQPTEVSVEHEVVPLEGEGGTLAIPAEAVALPAAGESLAQVTHTHGAAWSDARLWWPDDPFLYKLITRIRQDGKLIDETDTIFGYRNWGVEGTRFTLNGIPWQLRTDSFGGNTSASGIEHVLKRWREVGYTMFRHRFQNWGGMTTSGMLDFFDRHGIAVRRQVGNFDGQHASYGLASKPKGGEKVANALLFENWREVVRARTRQQRNHPCIFMFELDNEIIYINTRNFGNLDVVEPEFEKALRIVQELDRQGRPVNTGGGRALMNRSMPVNGCHYEAAHFREYPDAAYGTDAIWTGQSKKQPWPMALDKPIFLSEEFFASGYNPSRFAAVGGDICFAGRAACFPTIGFIARMYSEGYRWQALGGFHFWMAGGGAQYTVWSPVVALVREWNSTLAGGEAVERTVMVRNDTRFAEPIVFQWALQVGGEQVQTGEETMTIPPGEGQVTTITLTPPAVTSRTEAALELRCLRGGEEQWSESKPLSVIAVDAAPKPTTTDATLVVLDPAGRLTARLTERGIPHQAIATVDALPEEFDALIIGADTLSELQSASSRWPLLAAEGKRILVLAQQHPLQMHAVPADLEPGDYSGRIAFMEDASHAAFAGLEQSDFRFWSGDHIVYTRAYGKATRGAKSLIQCDEELGYTALAECRVADGMMLLCQMPIDRTLDSDPVARRLFDNLVNVIVDYHYEPSRSTVVMPADDLRLGLLDAIGLEHDSAGDPLAAMRDPDTDIVICDASPQRLAALADAQETVDAFTARGGNLMLWNLGADGLADFNRLTGQDHLIRPFGIERVALRMPRDPLARGLSQRDVTLYSGRRIVGWQKIEYVVDDLFSAIVDTGDIAPFMQGPGVRSTDPNRPSSLTNGFNDTEDWRLICYFTIEEDATAPSLEYQLPRRETITRFRIRPNGHYYLIKRLKLVPDDDESRAQLIELEEYGKKTANFVQTFELEPMSAEKLSLVLVEWEERKDKRTWGIDNMWVEVDRGPDYERQVKPLLNMGGLVRYPRGQGAIILNQLNILPRDKETVSVNADKKQNIVKVMLENLDAAFSGGGRGIGPGAELDFRTVSLENECNLYITANEGWFDKEHDFAHLPLGQRRFAGVDYHIRDFETSPLESAVSLPGMPGTKLDDAAGKGLPVSGKADALYLLYSWVAKKAWKPRGRKEQPPPVVFKLIVHYEDGSSQTIPMRLQGEVDNYRQATPTPLPGAVVAWTAPFPNDPGQHAVVYAKQWTNPSPELAISSVDLVYADKKSAHYGAPVLFAITAATNR